MRIENVSIGYNSLNLRKVDLEPKLTKQQYFKNKGFEDDWIKAHFTFIKINGISWRQLLCNKKFYAYETTLKGADIYVFRDKQLPDKYRYKPLISSLLQNIKTIFTISKIGMPDGKLTYEEVNEQTGKPIVISFNKLNAVIEHISSDTTYTRQFPTHTINAQASVLDSIDVQVFYTGNTLSKNDNFKMSGNIKPFAASYLNNCIEPSTRSSITDGYINYVKFNFSADNNSAKGKLDIDYSDLKLKVEEDVKQNKLKTFIANLFVKNDDDKSKTENYTGEISFSRKKDRFIFNYWWNAFKSGITSSILQAPAKKLVDKNKEKKRKN